MIGLVEVGGRVLVLGAVAAAHVTATQTQAKVHPGIATLQAFLATSRASGDFLDLI
jgi:hypothetical protein